MKVLQFDLKRRLGRCFQTITQEEKASLGESFKKFGPDLILVMEVAWFLGIEDENHEQACQRKYGRSFLYMFFSVVGKPVGEDLVRQVEWDKAHGRPSDWLELSA
jgi:hypothetical protein